MAPTSVTPSTTLLQEALAYLADEWSIFPVCTPVPRRDGRCVQHGDCRHPGKVPLVRWATYQETLPEASEVRSWWHTWPRANIGLATGELSNVVVIDVDNELAMAEAERRGYERGPWVSTGRVGGRHLYFRWRSDAPTIFAKTGGLDFRGQGGFVLLPPSLHATGALYHWGEEVTRGDPLPDLPNWVDEIAQTSIDGGPRAKIDFAQLLSSGIPDGQRDQDLFRAAARLRGVDMPYEVAVDVIQRIAARCQPPFDPVLAQAKVDSAYSRYQPNPERRSMPTPPPREAGPSGSTEEDDDIFNAAVLDKLVLPEPRWAIKPVFPEGVVLLAGKSKLGKSWFALDAAVAVSTGGLAWGALEAEQGDVLYLALEDSKKRIQDRMRQIRGRDDVPARLDFAIRSKRADEGGLARILKWMDTHAQARLIVIDVLGKFRPKEASQRRLYDADYDTIAPIADVARLRGICVLILHHANKVTWDDPVDSVSGTTGLVGAADAVCVFRRERGQADASLLVTGRDVEEQEIAFRFALKDRRGFAWQLIGDAATLRLSSERQAILDAVTRQPGMRPADIAAAVGKQSNGIRQMLFNMVHAGQLRSSEGRYYPGIFRSNTPYNTDDAEIKTVTLEPRTYNGSVTPVTGVTHINTDTEDTTARGVTLAMPLNGVTDTGCRACGGELSEAEAATRYRLHFDCSLPMEGGTT